MKDNTKVEYMYRDGSNYKTYGEAVFAGLLTPEQTALIMEHQDQFLPTQVGLSSLQENWESHYDDDHIWHEIVAVEPTAKGALHELTAAEFAEQFRTIVWDVEAAAATLDEWIADTPRGN